MTELTAKEKEQIAELQKETEAQEIWNGRFYVEGTIPEYEHRGSIYKNLPVVFFQEEMTEEKAKELLEPLGFTQSLENYELIVSYAQETFSIDQAQELAVYLQKNGVEAVIKPAYEPFENIIGVCALPVGGETDFLLISKHENYNLSFNAQGYIDTRRAEFSVFTPEYIELRVKDWTKDYSEKQFEELKDLFDQYIENKLRDFSEVTF